MTDAPLQDALLTHYLEMAGAADANVEERLRREPFDYRWFSSYRLPFVSTSVIRGDGRRPVAFLPKKVD